MNGHRQSLSFDKNGYVLIVTLFLLLLLSAIGITAIRTTNVEVRISGNYKTMVQEFHAAEGALIAALEHPDWWLNDAFATINPAVANWSRMVDFDQDNIPDALIEIRCVEPSRSPIASISNAANNFPADRHAAPPPVGSGYSARHFYVRKYAITSTGVQSGTNLQIGAWKIFNKYSK